jgi:uncharacterized protein with GYD domain
MANYVSLVQFTEQGIRAAKDTTKRAEAVKAQAAKMGVKVTDILWTLGAYDSVLIAEAPDDETMAAYAVSVALSAPRKSIRFSPRSSDKPARLSLDITAVIRTAASQGDTVTGPPKAFSARSKESDLRLIDDFGARFLMWNLIGSLAAGVEARGFVRSSPDGAWGR